MNIGSERRLESTSRLSDVIGKISKGSCGNLTIRVTDNLKVNSVNFLNTFEQAEEWEESLARASQWADKESRERTKKAVEELSLSPGVVEQPLTGIAKAIDPSHYQGYILDLQWLEAMQYLPRFRNPESFKAAVELQIRKYLDRNGGKDGELQELSKGLWYYKFLVAYIKNGNKPIRVADVTGILG
jgi:hypothetical protein